MTRSVEDEPPLQRLGISRRGVLLGVAGAAGLAVLGASPADAAVRWVKPLEGPINYTQGFDGTEYPYSPDGRHKALDMTQAGVPLDAAVYAMADGVVHINRWVDYLGNYLVLSYADTYYSLYAHLKARPSLSEGQSVRAGQRVATMGGTGNPPFEVHLHVELFRGGYDRSTPYPGGTRIDPYPIISAAPYPSQSPSAQENSESAMAYPIKVNQHMFLLSPGFIKHFNDLASAELARNITVDPDQWIALDTNQFLSQLDAFGVPRNVVDVVNGRVTDPSDGVSKSGGMWSWARAAYVDTRAIRAKLGA